MSIEHPERTTDDQLPPAPTRDNTQMPPEDHPEYRAAAMRHVKGLALATGALVAGGVFFAHNVLGIGDSDNDKTPQAKKPAAELVLDDNGNVVRYVEYSEEHPDRNHDGGPDKRTDSNGNEIADALELWDQIENKFVDPRAEPNADILANASQEDLSNIAQIRSSVGELFAYWDADFVGLDLLTKEFIMYRVNHPEKFESTEEWTRAVSLSFDYTEEEILKGAEEFNSGN